ncbi:MAG: ATP-binding protein [Candidatus Aminicenantes bacterium]|nr:MAG: ATP-binding protein [Candidatus Aminicenantes bacterium]
MYIAVASGKGGTGKTLVSTSLALCAKEYECTYVDLDVEEPNGSIFLAPEIGEEIPFTLQVPEIDKTVCTFCETCAKSCLFNALAILPPVKKAMFFPDLCHSCGVCTYVCPVDGAVKEVAREIGKIRIGRSGNIKFIEGRLKVGQLSGVPLIKGIINDYMDMEGLLIVDSSPGTSCPVVESLKGSDYVILVTEPNPFGLNDLELTVELVKELGKDAGIIVNKDNGQSTIIDEFSHEVNIPVILKIPYSIDIQKAYSNGIPLVISMPGTAEQFKVVLEMISRRS